MTDPVEVMIGFDSPVSAEDMRERFRDLADQMADVEAGSSAPASRASSGRTLECTQQL